MQHPQFSLIYKSVTAASLLLRPEIEFQHENATDNKSLNCYNQIAHKKGIKKSTDEWHLIP